MAFRHAHTVLKKRHPVVLQTFTVSKFCETLGKRSFFPKRFGVEPEAIYWIIQSCFVLFFGGFFFFLFSYWQLLFSYYLGWFCRDDREFNAYSFNFVYSFETQTEYICVFLRREETLQSSRKKNHVLGHGAFWVPKAAWMGIPEIF